mmetsp:Transcript_26825/g.45713  ORF Transcript_26825/g.45713 Transcript_26825/m.45713 type:complete len:246 (-) Transcript_26825:619-1356(-)
MEVVAMVIVTVEFIHYHCKWFLSLAHQDGNHCGIAPRSKRGASNPNREELGQRKFSLRSDLFLADRVIIRVCSFEYPADLILREITLHHLLCYVAPSHATKIIAMAGQQLLAKLLRDFWEVVQSLAVVAGFNVKAVFAQSISIGEVDHNVTGDSGRGDNAGESGSLSNTPFPCNKHPRCALLPSILATIRALHHLVGNLFHGIPYHDAFCVLVGRQLPFLHHAPRAIILVMHVQGIDEVGDASIV